MALSAGLLAGCDRHDERQILFDGTEDGLRKSVGDIAANLKGTAKTDLEQALTIYLDRLHAETPAGNISATTPIGSLSGISVLEFRRQAIQLQQIESPVDTAEHPVWTNPRMVELMELELVALEGNRKALNAAGYFTLDQLSFTPPSFIPPPEGEVRVANNKAIFAFRMSNNTGLAVYRPTFSVRVQVPGEDMPVYTGRLIWEDPVGIPDGTSRLVDISCCSILKEPYLNKRMRQLREDASITVELVSVEDYRKRNPLRTQGYDARDLQRERDLTACIRDVKSRVDTWMPKHAAPACKRLAETSRDGSQQLTAAATTVSSRIR